MQKIKSSGFSGVLGPGGVAFVKCGSHTIAVSNAWDTGRSITINREDGQLNYLIPAYADATIIWP